MSPRPEFNAPHRTEKLLKEAAEKGKLDHAGLMFYRYLEGRDSQRHLQQLQYLVREAKFPTLKEYRQRLFAFLNQWESCRSDFKTACFEGRLLGRLAPGLGIASVFENGISLEHIHGFPYIPASSLKGIAQDYARLDGVDHQSREFVAVFGQQTPEEAGEEFNPQQGKVIFLDAIPLEESNLLTVDVMTPHYASYYQSKGEDPPADYLDPKHPNPINFLTVRENVRFLFCLGASKLGNGNGEVLLEATAVLSYAREWLQGGLSTLGAGAKTAVGYGYFHQFRPRTI